MSMKMVVAIVQPQQLPDIKEALSTADVKDMTCTNILGTVANQFEEYKYRGVIQDITLFQKVRIEIAVPEQQVNTVIDALSEGAKQSGGSGLAFVTEIIDCVNLGTGDRGESVL
jgi:nitrogen regulatory protein PII